MNFITRAKEQSTRAKKYTVEENFDVYVRSLSMRRFQELREQFKEVEAANATSEDGASDSQLTVMATLLKETVCEEDGATCAFTSADDAKQFVKELSLPLLNALIKTIMKANGGEVAESDSFRG